MPELIENNVNGLLVDVGNAEGFSSAFQFYLDNPKELKDQSQSVRKLVLEKFSQESMASQYLEEYRVTR